VDVIEPVFQRLALWRCNWHLFQLTRNLATRSLQLVELIGQLAPLRPKALIDRARAGCGARRKGPDGCNCWRYWLWCGSLLQSIPLECGAAAAVRNLRNQPANFFSSLKALSFCPRSPLR